MNTTIVETRITLKNGKKSVIEEAFYEFCPEIWDNIKSFAMHDKEDFEKIKRNIYFLVDCNIYMYVFNHIVNSRKDMFDKNMRRAYERAENNFYTVCYSKSSNLRKKCFNILETTFKDILADKKNLTLEDFNKRKSFIYNYSSQKLQLEYAYDKLRKEFA
jgi:hypothetical protein